MKASSVLRLASVAAIAAAGLATAADAHMVAFGWKETPTGTVLYAEHWHGNLGSPYSDNGGLHITDTLTNNTITVQWAGVINDTLEGNLNLTGAQADPGNCCRGTYNDWMFTSALALGNGVYDFFTGTTCCVDTMTVPVRVTITGITNQPPGIGDGNTVPEPAAWALMILGFGLVGGSLRRRPMKAVHA